MKNISYIFYFFLLILIGCSSNNMKKITIQQTLPFTSDSLKKFYSINKNKGTYTINTKLLEKKQFTQSEKNIVPKNFITNYLKSDYYFPVLEFSNDSHQFIGLIYKGWCNKKEPFLLFQLNSYDKAGNIIDALVIEDRFSLDPNRNIDFAINKDGKIMIKKIKNYKVSKNSEFECLYWGFDQDRVYKETSVIHHADYTTWIFLSEFKINNNGNFVLFK